MRSLYKRLRFFLMCTFYLILYVILGCCILHVDILVIKMYIIKGIPL